MSAETAKRIAGRALEILTSPLFCLVIVKPLPNLHVRVRESNISESNMRRIRKTPDGWVVLETGSGATLMVGEKIIQIKDYEAQVGETPRAKITGDGIDVQLDVQTSTAEIEGIGSVEYVNDCF